MSEPLLSVVVPTRNRQQWALSLAEGFACTPADGVELILHDNSTDESLGAGIRQLGDDRIRYVYSDQTMNMHQNFDAAIHLAKGTYVCGLGDDDGIFLKPALDVLAKMRARQIDAVLTGICSFTWPSVIHPVWGDMGGVVTDLDLDVSEELLLDPRQELARIFSSGMTQGLGDLPRVYQGFVTRRSLERLFERCGTHFPGASPDMANAIGLVPFVNAVQKTSRLALISGHSPRSGGGAGAARTHHGRLEEQNHLPPGTLEDWDPRIPKFWSGITMYAQSAVTAAQRTSDVPVPPVEYHRLYADCIVFQPRRYWGDVLAAATQFPAPAIAILLVRTLLAVAARVVQRAQVFLRNFMLYRARRPTRCFSSIKELMLSPVGS